MSQINEINDKTVDTFTSMWNYLIELLPNIFWALIVLIIGGIITRIVVYLVKRILRLIKADKLDDVLNKIELFGKKSFNFNVINIITKFVKWSLYLVFLIIAAQILNWTIISDEITNLLHYIPKLLSGIALFLIGIYIANFLKNALHDAFVSFEITGAKFISQLVFYIITIIISITALNQAGINTDIITNNILLIFGSFLLAFAIAFGLGAKEIMGDLLRTYYTRRTYEVGQKIKVNDIDGKIVSVNDISMTLKTKTGKVIIPIKNIVENQVEIDS